MDTLAYLAAFGGPGEEGQLDGYIKCIAGKASVEQHIRKKSLMQSLFLLQRPSKPRNCI
jgi:hypothetical protein